MRAKTTVAREIYCRRERSKILVGISVLALLLVAACAGTSSDDNASGRQLVIAASGTPAGFDGDIYNPNMQNVVVNVLEPLVNYKYVEGSNQVDPNEIEPRLAKSWKSSPDGLVWDLSLELEVVSPAGNPFTSEDVVFSWEKSKSQGATGNFIRGVASVADVKALYEHTVRFTLDKPNPMFLKALALFVPGIYDSAELKKHSTNKDPFATQWLKTNLAGFGPYQITSVEPDVRVLLKANDKYYRGKPYYKEIVYLAVPDSGNRLNLLRSGEAQIANDVPFDQIKELKSSPSDNARVVSVEGNAFATVQMNTNYDEFGSVDVRRALALAVDQEAIVDDVFYGLASVAKSPVAPQYPCYTGDYWDFGYDPDAAKSLLERAGVGDSLSLELSYSDSWWFEEPLAIAVKSYLEKAGVKVKLSKLLAADMFAQTAPGLDERTVPYFTWQDGPAIVMDAGYQLFLMGHTNGVANRNSKKIPEVNALVEKANTTVDPDERCALLEDVQEKVVSAATWQFSALLGHHEAMSGKVEGFVWHPDGHERWFDFHATK